MNLVLTYTVSSMTPIKQWCGNKHSVDQLRTFKCIAWEHIYDSCRNKMDAKSHTCLMMGYYDESKAYWLFDPIKKQIIIRRNMILNDNYLGIKFLNSSYGLLSSDSFDIVPNSILTTPLLSILTSLLTSLTELIGSWLTLTETITSLDWCFERNNITLTPCLPKWSIETLESVGSDVGDISCGL